MDDSGVPGGMAHRLLIASIEYSSIGGLERRGGFFYPDDGTERKSEWLEFLKSERIKNL